MAVLTPEYARRRADEVLSFSDFVKRKLADNVEGYSFAWLEKSGLKDKVK